METKFRTPVDADDAKKAIRKIDRNLKKARAERDDCERSLYDMGVKVADVRIAELTAAREHFSKAVRS